MCKDLCQQLYTGDNIKYLEGPDKIPVYLSIFLEHMKKQAEEFKIAQVRQLRTSAERLQSLAVEIPRSVLQYLKVKFTAKIVSLINEQTEKFSAAKQKDD
jgi:restriction endonuclease S subunit